MIQGLQKIFSYCRPPSTPKYGLGYIGQANSIILDYHFNNPLSEGIQKPYIPKMHKLFSLMKGCDKWQVNRYWMKRMINWNLFTHPHALEFNSAISNEQKRVLAKKWQPYMKEKDFWISSMSGNPKLKAKMSK